MEEKGITFCLTCFATCVICFGLIITVIAGVAYGYNYSFAEFITHTRSDVTIYMKRGQFYDQPDIAPAPNRRMGDEDVFSSKATSEYEEQVQVDKDSEPASDKWLKDEDAREYAIKLTKYKANERTRGDKSELTEQQKINLKYTSSLPSTRRLTKIPNVISTTVWRSGTSEIILRKFLPLKDITEDFRAKESIRDFYKDSNDYITRPNEIEFSYRQMQNIQPDVKIRFDDIPERKLMPISATNSQKDQDEFLEDGNEDNVIYKPV